LFETLDLIQANTGAMNGHREMHRERRRLRNGPKCVGCKRWLRWRCSHSSITSASLNLLETRGLLLVSITVLMWRWRMSAHSLFREAEGKADSFESDSACRNV